MRHQRAGIKLNRTGSHRNAMLRNMVTSLFEHGRIHTTDAKAKELRRWADRIITLAKRGDLHARRKALSIVRSKAVVHKLFEDVSSRFGQRTGGYTRIIKLGRRMGDAAPISLVEFVAAGETKQKEKPKRKKTAGSAEGKQKVAQEKKKGDTEKEEVEKKAAETTSQKEAKASGGGEEASAQEGMESAEPREQASGGAAEDKIDEES